MAGTILGAFTGVAFWYISHGNPYAIVVLALVAEVFTAYLILYTNTTGIGVVYAVTYSVIIFIPYLSSANETVILLAWNRGYQIFLGIVGALLINTLAWPYHARSNLSSQISMATMELQTLYLSLSRQMIQGGLEPSKESAREFEELEMNLQSRFAKGRSLVGLISAEISLVPKPFHLYSSILTHLQSISDHLTGLRLCREHGMRAVRREAILNVLDFRRELVSVDLSQARSAASDETPPVDFLHAHLPLGQWPVASQSRTAASIPPVATGSLGRLDCGAA